jgi:lysozyme
MNKVNRALWRRRLSYRLKRASYWRSRGNMPKVNHWIALSRQAKEKLGMVTLAPARGIDVSSYNGSVNWKAAKAGGIKFAFCKVSEGADWADPTWTTERVKAMRAAGVKVGVYHFLRPRLGRTGADEMAFFMKRARAAGWGKPGDLRPVIDFEDTTTATSMTIEYLASAVRYLKKETGKAPIIYTGGPFWDKATGRLSYNFECPLWLAAYVKNPDAYLPAAWKKDGYSIWQNTDKGAVPGVPGDNVDQNIAKRLPLL